ncbi:MAG: hypothetical protein ACREF3_13935, partial [Acetobacteraceae bacterium]
MRISTVATIGALLGTSFLCGQAHAIATCTQPLTGWNFNVPAPPPGPVPTDLEIFLPGDQVGCAVAGYNSFQSPPFPATFAETYNPGRNLTKLEFTGLADPALSPAPFHFGFDGFVPGELVGGERLPPVAITWTFGHHAPVHEGVVGIHFTNNDIGAITDYFIFYVLAEFPDGDGLG